MIIVDTHTHAGQNWFEPVEMLVHQMNMNSVDKAVLIQHGRPATGGYDHTYLFECVERFPGRFGVVVIVDVKLPDAVETLERHAARGALGVRLNPSQRSPDDDPLAIWRKADELGMVVSCMGGQEDLGSDDFRALVDGLPSLPIVIEHLAGGGEGVAFPRSQEGPQPPYTAYKKALDLADFSNVYIKVHGLGEISARPPVLPAKYDLDFYDHTPPLIELALDAFGPRRMMWGSDYPPVSGREGYSNSLRAVLENPVFGTQDDREWVVGKTALSVFKLE